jgi:hypothetical protein
MLCLTLSVKFYKRELLRMRLSISTLAMHGLRAVAPLVYKRLRPQLSCLFARRLTSSHLCWLCRLGRAVSDPGSSLLFLYSCNNTILGQSIWVHVRA